MSLGASSAPPIKVAVEDGAECAPSILDKNL
jgi:hypothetical protein